MFKKILNYTLFLVSLFTILTYDVNALQTEPSAVQFYDNYGSYLTPVSTDFVNDVYYGYLGLTANSTGGAIGLRLNENIVSGHMYSLTLNIGVPAGGYTSASSKNVIGVGSNLTNAVNSYVNSNGSTISYTQGGTYEAPHYISFVFNANFTGSYIVVPYNTINGCLGSCENYFKGYTLNDLGLSNNLTDSEVNTIINNQTSLIQESINNIENNINNTIKDNFTTETCIPLSKNLANPNDIILNKEILSGNTLINNPDWFVIYIPVDPNTTYTASGFSSVFYALLDKNKFLISNGFSATFTTTSDTYYVLLNGLQSQMSSLQLEKSSFATSYVPYSGNCASINKFDETNQQLGDINNNLNNSDTSGATNQAGDFFSGFQTDTFGLTSIITAPLNLIGNITSSSCSPVGLPLPYVDKTLNLPCLSSIYREYFGSFLTLYQIITFGIVAYWVCIRIFALVKDFKNPDHDEIEVLDL